MDPLRNPYRPGAGTQPPALIGRDDIIDNFGVALRRASAGMPGKSVVALGLRGVGKTVLLNRFAEIARMEGFKVGFVEAPETGAFRTLLAIHLRQILLELEQSGPVSVAVSGALAVLKSFVLTLPDGTSIRLSQNAFVGRGDSGIFSEDLTDVLVAAGEAASDRGTGILISVDEFQYLADQEFAALIVAIHRTTQLDLPVVLVGAGLPQVPRLAGDAKSYAERLFAFTQVGELASEEAAQVLTVPAADGGVEITAEAVGEMVAASRGYPYFLQEWGSAAWNAAPGSPIGIDDVTAARPVVRQSLDDNFFRVRLDRLTPKEREYLHAMAKLGPGPHRSGDIAQQLSVKVESVAPRRSALIRKGMVYSPAHGDTAFTVPLFDEFILRAEGGA